MNESIKDIIQKKSSTAQAVANVSGNQGKVLIDNRNNNSLQMKENNTNNITQLKEEQQATNNIVIQLGISRQGGKKLSAAEKRKKEKRKENKYALNPNSRYDDTLKAIRKEVSFSKIYIKDLLKQVDDDSDIELLNNYNYQFNKIYKEAKKVRLKINTAPSGRFRSESKLRDKLINELLGFQFAAYKLLDTLRKQFPTNQGGFGAKGRAHAIDTDFVPKSNSKAPKGKTLDNTFLENITIDGKTNNLNIYKTTPKVAKESSGPLQILGQRYATNSNINKSQLLANVDKGLSLINSPQNKDFTNTPAGKDRGFGQYANMNNTNAAGYAWLMGIPGILDQRWEWLHIRGAGLGGSTDSTNLVAGTRDANTQMIPFESNIRTLATAVGNNNTKYSRLEVKWSVTKRIEKHAYQWIRIAWTLFKKKGAIQTQGEAYFQPLHTGSNISKKEVEKLESALQEVRSNL